MGLYRRKSPEPCVTGSHTRKGLGSVMTAGRQDISVEAEFRESVAMSQKMLATANSQKHHEASSRTFRDLRFCLGLQKYRFLLLQASLY